MLLEVNNRNVIGVDKTIALVWVYVYCHSILSARSAVVLPLFTN